MPPELTDSWVIEAGGWHPRYARVLAVATEGRYGYALVDGNGDGAELEAEWWFWTGEVWTSASSSGAGALGGIAGCSTASWWHSPEEVHVAFGRAPGAKTVRVDFGGERHSVRVGPEGCWVFVGVTVDDDSTLPPTLAA